MQTDSPSKSSERTPRVQSRRPFCVVAAWHRDLWSVNPPCLWRIPAFTSVSRVYFCCPGDTLSFINPEMALEAAWPMDGGMFLKGGNKAVSEKWGQKGKASHHPVTVRPSSSHLASSSDAEERGGLLAFGFDVVSMKAHGQPSLLDVTVSWKGKTLKQIQLCEIPCGFPLLEWPPSSLPSGG